MVATGKIDRHPRGMLLLTGMLASSEQAWDPIAKSSAQICSKMNTMLPQPMNVSVFGRTNAVVARGWCVPSVLCDVINVAKKSMVRMPHGKVGGVPSVVGNFTVSTGK